MNFKILFLWLMLTTSLSVLAENACLDFYRGKGSSDGFNPGNSSTSAAGYTHLLETWPDRIRRLTQIKMASDRRLHDSEVRRNVTIISTAGLSKNEIEQLKYDYLNAFPGLTVLLSGKHPHLYLRYGRMISHLHLQRGLIGRIDTLPYQVASSERVEAVLNLNAVETQRWETFLHNSADHKFQTLGFRAFIPYNFGVKSWETNGELRNNWFKDWREKHNCTTWLMCAPLGEHGERVFQMLGATQKDLEYYQVHSNFKMTSEYLLNGASPDRVNEIIYWTGKPVDEAVAELEANPKLLNKGMFKWNERYAQDAADANQ